MPVRKIDFEKIIKVRNKNGETGYVYGDDIVNFLANFFDNALYNQVPSESEISENKNIYQDNANFWKDILDKELAIAKTITLKKFCILEWLPSSPGLYFTMNAYHSRREAERLVDEIKLEYLPLGKLRMIQGGIGSVRLSSENNRYYLGASSTGISHQGIPLILTKNLYNQYIDAIKNDGYFIADVIGTLEIIPSEKSLITYEREILRCVLIVDKFIPCKRKKVNIQVTVAALFSLEREFHYNAEKRYSYASFFPDKKEDGLLSAVNWIEDYSKRYSEKGEVVRFLSDFDEHKNHFSSFTELQLPALMTNNFNIETLLKYSIKLQFTINKTVMGDNFENISGNFLNKNKGDVFIATNSTISDSFTKRYGEDATNALKQVLEIVNQSENQSAKELFESFKEELEREKPKKTVLQQLWNGIISAVPLIQSSVQIVAKIMPLIG